MGGRALVLAGGGVRVAWQAGVVQALDEAGLTFDHGDGTSGGIFTLGMLLSGVPAAELGARWRALSVRRFVGLLPLREYLRPPTSWPALGGAGGIEAHVLPVLGIDPGRIRAATHMTGSFNVADFGAKRCVAIPHTEIDRARLVAGVSLPILLPAVEAEGRTWTDAVWIRDANLWEAVRRGCTELWVAWLIGNGPRFGRGPLEQYVNMIELSANGALFAELERIGELNERRRAGEAVLGSTEPVTVHVVTPQVPIPLDPYLLLGRIDAEALVATGYRDAQAYLASAAAGGGGVALGEDVSAVTSRPAPPLGARLSIRAEGRLRPVAGAGGPTGASRLLAVVEAADLAAFAGSPEQGVPVVGAFTHPAWGYRPFSSARLRVLDEPGLRRFVLDATVHAEGSEWRVHAAAGLPDRGPGRWTAAASLTWRVFPAGGTEPVAAGHATLRGAEVLRIAASFEPSGAAGVGDRLRALVTASRLVRQRPASPPAGAAPR